MKRKNIDNENPIEKEKKNDKPKILLGSEKIKLRETRIKYIKFGLLIITLFLFIIYFLLRIAYEAGDFTISLDPQFAQKSGLVMYESLDSRHNDKRILKATKVEYMDNISVNWLPNNLDELGEGSHNGDNYLAYTFYLENMGSDPIDYWYQIIIDDVIKNVDRAIRVMIILNGESTIYARPNETTGEAERGTTMFHSEIDVVLQERENFEPGQVDKFTVVVFIEGDDPDCVDALIGGELKMHMDITEEHITI